MNHEQSPSWMKLVLRLAGIYNLLWGAAVVLAPGFTSSLAGFDPAPRYPQLWQCIGMIVGVYGIGYWIAASNPVRHWPIVLVGFLGKIFGPIGLVGGLIQGTLPIQMAYTCLFNDLIWWVPFGMILWHAATQSSQVTLRPGSKPSETLTDQNGMTVAEHSYKSGFLLVFLRHTGCTFCREAIADVVAVRDELKSADVEVGFVFMGAEESTGSFEDYGAQDIPRFSDPQRQLYAEFELGTGSLLDLFGPASFIRGFSAGILKRHGIGKLEGNGLQMPGAFLVRDGRVVSAFRHKKASDRPDYVGLCKTTDQFSVVSN
ncbi:MAG: SelL-related redox protein [Planctomycetaceae bacterium]